MAKAKLNPSLPIKPEVVLTLSYDEAETLFTLVGKVTGSITNSRRAHTDRVYYALMELGLNAHHAYISADNLVFSSERGIS